MLLIAESYVHRLDPFVLRFTQDFGIRWYGLAYLTGFLVGWLILRWMCQTGRAALSTSQLESYLTAMILGVLLGGRVGHVVFYEPHLLYTFTSSPPWWELLALHHGGMSSHGGILGVVVAAIWFGRRHRLDAVHLLDLVALACPIGLGLGRVANFINGELWGRALPESMRAAPPWWSIKYPEEVLLDSFDPARLGSIAPLVDPTRPLAEATWSAVAIGREDVIAKLTPLLTPHYPSQLMQAATDGVILMLVLSLVWWKPRKPGAIGSAFLITYGGLRLATEQFREPDEGVLWIGVLTLPMLLSLLMIVSGIGYIAVTQRRDVPRLGGLWRRASD